MANKLEGPSQTEHNFIFLIAVTFTLIVYTIVVIAINVQQKNEIRRQIINRDAETIYLFTTVNSQGEKGLNIDDIIPPWVKENTQLSPSSWSSELQGIIALQIFDKDGLLKHKIPDDLIPAALENEDIKTIQKFVPISKFHDQIWLESFFLISQDFFSEETLPILEVIIPYHHKNSNELEGIIQYWIDGKSMAAELSLLNKNISIQTGVALLGGYIILLVTLYWAFFRLRSINFTLRAEVKQRLKTEKILEARDELIKSYSLQTEQFSLAAASIIASKDEKEIYASIISAILDHSDYRCVLIIYFTDTTPYYAILGSGGMTEKEIEDFKKKQRSAKTYQELFEPSNKKELLSTLNPQNYQENILNSLNDIHVAPEGEVYVPLIGKTDELLGVIMVGNSKTGLNPTSETVRPLEIFSSLISQIIINKKSQEDINQAKSEIEIANQRLVELNKILEKSSQKAIQLAQKAEAATKTKSEFLANMSHEIRTPMNAILGFASLSLQSYQRRNIKEYLEKIHTAGLSLTDIIDDILDFSKIEAGKLELENINFDLTEIFENISDMFSDRAAEKGIELNMELNSIISTELIGDPARIKQVLINLISNAIKFTDHGKVTLKAQQQQNSNRETRIKFEVSDTGLGISQENLTKIFDSFVQADSSKTRKYGGTGLGLAICVKLVDLMGSKLEAESKENVGSIFSFEINFQIQRDLQQANIHHPSILIIDSNEKTDCDFIEMLQPFSKDITFSKSDQEVFNLLKRKSFDFVFIDDNNQQSHAIELAINIGALSGKNDMPIILMSSSQDFERLNENVKKKQISNFLKKPIQQIDLFNVIYSATAQKINTDFNRNQLKSIFSLITTQPISILVAEDNVINQQLTKELLNADNINLQIVENGKEAVLATQNHKPDLIFMDIQMPEMDGFQATELIRNKYPKEELTIIALTAHVMKSDRERCLNIGMNDFLSKPITIQKLYETICKWLPDVSLHKTERSESNENKYHENIHQNMEIDLNQIIQKIGGNKLLLRDILIKFHENFLEATSNIEHLLKEKKTEPVINLISRIRDSAENLGLAKLAELSANLKKAIIENQNSKYKKLLLFSSCLKKVFEDINVVEKQLLEETSQSVIGSEKSDINQVIANLKQSLETNDMEAGEYYQVLKNLITTDQQKSEIQQLGTYISRFEYDNAKEILEQIVASQ